VTTHEAPKGQPWAYRIVYHVQLDRRRADAAFTTHELEAFLDDRRVGYLTAFSRTDDPTWVQVDGLAVHPDHRRRGIATALMDALAAREPQRLIRHGGRTRDGQRWWLAYRRRVRFDRRRHDTGWRDRSLDGFDWRD